MPPTYYKENTPSGTVKVIHPTAERGDSSPTASDPKLRTPIKPQENQNKGKGKGGSGPDTARKSTKQGKGKKKELKVYVDYRTARSPTEQLFGDGDDARVPSYEPTPTETEFGWNKDGVEEKITGAKVTTRRTKSFSKHWNPTLPGSYDAPAGEGMKD